MLKFWMRQSIGVKCFVVCFGLSCVVSLTGALITYRTSERALREEVSSNLRDIAVAASMQIDCDAHRLIRSRSDETSTAYASIRAKLMAIKEANPRIRNIYTLRPTRGNEVFAFVVDARSGSSIHTGLTCNTGACPEVAAALAGPTVASEPRKDAFGFWVSAFAPVVNAIGRPEAIVGVDMSLDQVQQEVASLKRSVVLSGALAIPLAAILSFLVSRAVLSAVRTLSKAAESVKNGDLDVHVVVRTQDELKDFVDEFNDMVVGLRESRERLLQSTSRDFLTGLYNHAYFQQKLLDEIERGKRYGRTLSLLIIDLDRFKAINDTLGHPVGDSVVVQLANLLRENTRVNDIVARYGGDEFAIILPETGAEAAFDAAEMIRARVEGFSFRVVPLSELDTAAADEKTARLTVTIGVASFPAHNETREGLVMAADIGLCRAKHISRNSVGMYDLTTVGNEVVDPRELYEMLRDPNAAAIRSLAAAVDAKDRYTHGHSERVTYYAVEICEQMGMSDELLDAVRVAGLLHDLGKIGVPDTILNKAGSLTQDERGQINEHPSVGANILRRAPQLEQIVPGVLFHHERWDGHGYPDGLKGEAIPLVARILAVADAFDAMTSDRPYRKGMSIEAAVMELRANSGKQFDPALVEQFIDALAASEEQKAA